MNKTKNIALISFIIFIIATLASIVAAPFAAKSGIAYYNQLVDEGETSQDLLVKNTILPESVKKLELSTLGWMRVKILPSENGQIYFELYNGGLNYGHVIESTISEDGTSAAICLGVSENRKITEENIRTTLLASVNGYHIYTVSLHLPQDAALIVQDEYLLDNIAFGSTPFANREELMAQAGFNDIEETDLSYCISRISDLQDSINGYKLPKSYDGEYDVPYSVSTFQEETYGFYQEIADYRRQMLQEVYSTAYKKAVPNEDYLLVEELTQAEKERDLLEAKLNYMYEDMKAGRITENVYIALKAEQETALAQAQATVLNLEEQFHAICFPSPTVETEVTAEAIPTEAPQKEAAAEEPAAAVPLAPAQ